MNWTINRGRFNTAVRELGLTWPVRIRISPDPPAEISLEGVAPGCQNVGFSTAWGTDENPRHIIWLCSYQDLAQAARTLWHELCHAKDLELMVQRYGFDNTRTFYKTERLTLQYDNRPIEKRASEMEGCALTYPLVEEKP